MKFEWDENKRIINLQKHNIDFANVWQVFNNATHTIIDDRFDYGEIRYLSLGLLFGVVIAVSHTETDEITRIISVRKAENISKKNTLEGFGTDLERLRNMKDEDIDYSDIPKTTPEMWENALLRKNFKPIPSKFQENLPVDCDIIEFFKSQDFNYPAKVNQLLREYMEAQQAK